jgi:DNA-binding NtrC family response regulator
VLRFDRYLVVRARSHPIDLATGQVVDVRRAPARGPQASLFDTRRGRTLIDLESSESERLEVWEPWAPPQRPLALGQELLNFTELLDCARHGEPRAFDLCARHARDHEYLKRALAREARLRGWVPISVELLGALAQHGPQATPLWLEDRSLVIFAQTPALSGEAVVALLRLARRDERPHVLVRTLARGPVSMTWPMGAGSRVVRGVHESLVPYESLDSPVATTSTAAEAFARWELLVADTTGDSNRSEKALALATVLATRDQPFEARALLATLGQVPPDLAARGLEVAHLLDSNSRRGAQERLEARSGHDSSRGWEMVDDFVDVLRICQEVEDEQLTLARVGAFLRDRLQASSVAFVAWERGSSRVLARIGSNVADIRVALRSMEAGVPVGPDGAVGPVEASWPVRHGAEVIGAVWCRWSAGTPVAAPQATTLLGIVAAAVSPSVRLALLRAQPQPDRTNLVPELVGDSAAMLKVREAIVRAAASPFPVLIEGESGSGKELAARAIHARSVRRDRRFCAINCAALVDDLVEADLFGHVRGAFTGAAADRPGVFEEASGGTLFLDEVVELGGRVQAKLLRTLQEGEIRRVGETSVRRVDVRIVAATNRSLAAAVAAGEFRADLWYRLDVIRIALPPLRDRLEDLPGLVAHVWRGLTSRTESRATLAAATVVALGAYAWPGNVRELQNVLASMLVSAPRSGVIKPAALPMHIARAAALERSATLADARRQFDERYVRAALAKAGGHTVAAARELGLSRQGLSKLMGRLGIAEHHPKSPESPM